MSNYKNLGAPYSTIIYGGGRIAASSNIVIVHPSTCGQSGQNQIGEVWIENSNRPKSFETVIGVETDFDHENAQLCSKIRTSGFNKQSFINTKLIGFIKAPESESENPNLYIIGHQEETIMIRGMSFQPEEIESSIFRCHRLEWDVIGRRVITCSH
jgi:acyl-CoA synthetase (AMP-forming)/AMP-acid ligase II